MVCLDLFGCFDYSSYLDPYTRNMDMAEMVFRCMIAEKRRLKAMETIKYMSEFKRKALPANRCLYIKRKRNKGD